MDNHAPDQVFDLVVCGAGIQGSGIAQAAAAAGWKILVLEKAAAPAAGTSSRSSKLIHGGLRYLETMQLGLVRQSLREKALLLRLAPTLVTPARFVIPVYRESRRSPLWIQLGLWLYRVLAWPARKQVRGRYAQSEWREHPALRQEGLRAIFEYQDAQTDDAALTNAVLHSAKELGAELRFGARIVRITHGDKLFTLHLEDGTRIRSRTLVNATGPWVNRFIRLFDGCTPPSLDIELVQGSHLVLNRAALACCYYLEAPDDGRAVFVLPWKGKVLIGTTELPFEGDPQDCAPTAGEIAYLLRAFNRYFPALAATENDIAESFAGLRVLPAAPTSATARSRETVLVSSHALPGYLGVYGGKLTAYRGNAELAIDKLQAFVPARARKGDTESLVLRCP